MCTDETTHQTRSAPDSSLVVLVVCVQCEDIAADKMPEAEQYHLSTLAHVKVLMHALKYGYSSVNGFLLVEEGKKGSREEGGRVDIVDAIPLFHLGHGLTPMIEVALLQVRSGTACVLYKERASQSRLSDRRSGINQLHSHPSL